MPAIEPQPAQNRPHPRWCDPAFCSIGAGPHGTHRSTLRTIMTRTGRIDSSLEQGHHDAAASLLVERRQCHCPECEPLDVFLLDADATRNLRDHLSAVLTALLTEQFERDHPLAPPGGHESWCQDQHDGPCGPAGAR